MTTPGLGSTISFPNDLKVAQGNWASLQPGLAPGEDRGLGAGHGTGAGEQLLCLRTVASQERRLRDQNIVFHVYHASVSRMFLHALSHWNSTK